MAEARFRPRAEADLAEIWEYTKERWSLAQADTYIDALLDAADDIAKRPELGRSAEDIRPGYRKHRCQAHVIFYKPASYGVDVVRVLHGSMDFPARLKDT